MYNACGDFMARPRKADQLHRPADLDCEVRIVHLPAVQTARKSLPSTADLARLADFMAVMADPTRLQIVAALKSTELCVCDLSAVIGISESAVSHQLRAMRELKIVRSRRQGRMVFYSLDDDHVDSIYRQAHEHVRHSEAMRK